MFPCIFKGRILFHQLCCIDFPFIAGKMIPSCWTRTISYWYSKTAISIFIIFTVFVTPCIKILTIETYFKFFHKSPIEMVGVERFELPTSWSQTRRSTRLTYTPIFFIADNNIYNCSLSTKNCVISSAISRCPSSFG